MLFAPIEEAKVEQWLEAQTLETDLVCPEFTTVESDKDPTSVGSSNKGLYWFTEAGVVHRID